MVITKISTKICNDRIVFNTTTKRSTGRRCGSVTWRTRAHRPPPSSATASWSTRGTVWSPARKSSM